MFKGVVVQNDVYYALRKKMMFIGLVFGPLTYFLSHKLENQTSLILWVLFMIFYFFTHYRLAKNLKNVVNQKKILIDDNQITITDFNDSIIETYPINQIKNYSINQDLMVQEEEFKGKNKHSKSQGNYIEIKTDNQPIRFDFIIETHYMRIQLVKILESWKTKQITSELMEAC